MSARRHFIDNIRWPMIILVVSMHGPILAEDLGVITDDVVALRKGFGLPGMRVLQFAFSGEGDNPHLPHMHGHDSVVYTGTHDNDTTLGWYIPQGADWAPSAPGFSYAAINAGECSWCRPPSMDLLQIAASLGQSMSRLRVQKLVANRVHFFLPDRRFF